MTPPIKNQNKDPLKASFSDPKIYHLSKQFSSMKILLVEPPYYTRYPPLGLTKQAGSPPAKAGG
jgi:hypothetical protein